MRQEVSFFREKSGCITRAESNRVACAPASPPGAPGLVALLVFAVVLSCDLRLIFAYDGLRSRQDRPGLRAARPVMLHDQGVELGSLGPGVPELALKHSQAVDSTCAGCVRGLAALEGFRRAKRGTIELWCPLW